LHCVVAIIAEAAKLLHKILQAHKVQIAAANSRTVGNVEIIPVAKPAITLVPAPVLDFER
jgi:hypothetical protein